MRIILPLTVVLLFGQFINLGTAQTEKAPIASKPLVVLAGANSHIHKPSFQRITTPAAWARTWASHLGTSTDDAYRPTLEVDFDRCLVVAVLCGDEVNVRGMEVASIRDSAESLFIRVERMYYQTAGEGNNKPPDRPYAFIVLPKTDKNIVLEENTQQYSGRPPVWKQWVRLEGSMPSKSKPRAR